MHRDLLLHFIIDYCSTISIIYTELKIDFISIISINDKKKKNKKLICLFFVPLIVYTKMYY